VRLRRAGPEGSFRYRTAALCASLQTSADYGSQLEAAADGVGDECLAEPGSQAAPRPVGARPAFRTGLGALVVELVRWPEHRVPGLFRGVADRILGGLPAIRQRPAEIPAAGAEHDLHGLNRSSAPQPGHCSQGSTISMPVPSKSDTLRVASAAPWERQTAAISASKPAIGFPARSRLLAMTA
jgi:hypothetical protein